MTRLIKLTPAIALGGAHAVIHFTVPVLDILMHGAFFVSLYYGVKNG